MPASTSPVFMPTQSVELDAVVGEQLLIELRHRRLHAQRRSDGALGVVLVRDRRAEDRHHVVADVLVHAAADTLDLLGETAQAAVHERLDRLRVKALGDRCVAGQVGEQDRDRAPLLGRGIAGAAAREPPGLALGDAVGAGGRLEPIGLGRGLECRTAGSAEAGLGGGRLSALRTDPRQPCPTGHAELRAQRVIGAALLAGGRVRHGPLMMTPAAHKAQSRRQTINGVAARPGPG